MPDPQRLKPIADLSIREYLLENDTWLPSQVLSTNGSRCLPERSLLFELLVGALHDLDHKREKIRRRALRWLLSSSYHSPFTCAQVCDYLHLDHQSLKTKVKAGLLRLLRSRRDSTIRHHVTDEIPFYAPEVAPRQVHPVTLEQLELFNQEAACNSSPAPAFPDRPTLNSPGIPIPPATSLKTNETPSESG